MSPLVEGREEGGQTLRQFHHPYSPRAQGPHPPCECSLGPLPHPVVLDASLEGFFLGFSSPGCSWGAFAPPPPDPGRRGSLATLTVPTSCAHSVPTLEARILRTPPPTVLPGCPHSFSFSLLWPLPESPEGYGPS